MQCDERDFDVKLASLIRGNDRGAVTLRVLLSGVLVAASGGVGFLAFMQPAAAALAPGSICHANAANNSPYVVNGPDFSAQAGGHAGHVGPVWYDDTPDAWGDIIPPFDYVENGVTKTFAGLNWGTIGQEIWANDCGAVSPDLRIVKTSTGDGVVTGTGSYYLDVSNIGNASALGSAAQPLIVKDTMPAGVVSTGAAGAGWTCSVAVGGGSVTCERPTDLSPGAAAGPITVSVSWVTVGTKTNTATVDAALGEKVTANNSSTISTTVSVPVPVPVPVPVLTGTVVKTVDADGDGAYAAVEEAPSPGSTVTFRAVVTNTSAVSVDVGALTDSYGAVVEDPVACAVAQPATLAAGASFTCDFPIANYAPPAGTSLVNTFTATLSRSGSTSVTPQGTAQTSTAPALSGTVVKTSDADGDGTWADDETTPAAGAAVTFRARVTNTSGVTVSLGALSDTYGAAPGTTITPTCATTPPATLAHNASYTCEFTVAGYTAPTGGSVSNTFSAPLSRAGSNPTTPTGTAVVRTGQVLSGTVVKTVDADGDSTYSASESAPAAGATASFRAVVTNTSGVDVSLGALTDSYGTVVAAPVTCAAAAPAILTASGAGSSFACEFDIANYAPAAGQSLVNTVEVTLSRAGSAPVGLQSTATTATARPDLQLSKTSSGAAVAGVSGSYFIDVKNVGGGGAAGPFTVTDDLPDGVVATAAASASGGWACTITNGGDDVSCTHGASLASGASADRITVSVQWVAVGTKNNSATVSAASGETALANNTEGDSTVVTAAAVPDLQLTKSGPAARTTGQTGDYVLLVQNVGTAAVTAPITVTDTLPDGVTVSGPVASGGFACTTAAGVVTCTTQGDLAVGGSTTITLPASFTSAGNKANSATVSVSGDGNSANDTSVASTSVTDPGGPPPPPPPPAPADLAVKKTGPASVVPGGTAVWALTVTNKGPGNASGFAVTDTLPAGVSLVSVAGTGFSCTTATLGCTYAGVLLPGSSATVTVVGTVSQGVQGDALANVVVVGPTDATPSDNTDTLLSVISRPAAPADLVLEKAAPAAPVLSGTEVVWTITVTNAGGSAASGFAVTDPLALGLTLVSAEGAGFACGDGPAVECTYAGPLAPGQAATLVVTSALADDYTSSSVTNTATAALEGDPTPANNTDSATTGVSVPISGGGEEPVTGEPPAEEPQEVPPSPLPATDEEPAAAPPARPATLPFTGSSTDQLLALGAALSLLGLLLALTGRRRRAAQ